MLARAKSKVVHSLDLVELLHRQRMLLLAVLAMLPPHSVELIKNLSMLPIYESSSLEKSSDEDTLQAIRSKKVTELDKIVKKLS